MTWPGAGARSTTVDSAERERRARMAAESMTCPRLQAVDSHARTTVSGPPSGLWTASAAAAAVDAEAAAAAAAEVED